MYKLWPVFLSTSSTYTVLHNFQALQILQLGNCHNSVISLTFIQMLLSPLGKGKSVDTKAKLKLN